MFLKKQYLQTQNNPKWKPRPLKENDHGAQLNGDAPPPPQWNQEETTQRRINSNRASTVNISFDKFDIA